jgi:hypothetical protein
MIYGDEQLKGGHDRPPVAVDFTLALMEDENRYRQAVVDSTGESCR